MVKSDASTVCRLNWKAYYSKSTYRMNKRRSSKLLSSLVWFTKKSFNLSPFIFSPQTPTSIWAICFIWHGWEQKQSNAALARTCTHTYSHSDSHTPTHTRLLELTHTYSLSRTYLLAHTHTHTHALTCTQFLARTCSYTHSRTHSHHNQLGFFPPNGNWNKMLDDFFSWDEIKIFNCEDENFGRPYLSVRGLILFLWQPNAFYMTMKSHQL